jgi:hypothetical protein
MPMRQINVIQNQNYILLKMLCALKKDKRITKVIKCSES